MTSEQTTPPPNYTGMTSAIGGSNSWSCYGGSRLILANTDKKTYEKFDLVTNPITIIKFSTDLSRLRCGIVAAFYMVAMDSVPMGQDFTGTLYNDAQGVGLNNGTSGLNSKNARSEIDLLEASSRSAQTTLHGYNDTPPKNRRWVNKIDMDGIWNNINVDTKTGKYNQVFGNSIQGDAPNLSIDTKNPIDVTCTIKTTQISNTDNYTINLTTEIHQDGKTMSLNVNSNDTNSHLQQNTKTYFPKSELQKMCFIYSLWADYDSNDTVNCKGQKPKHSPTKWLDGNLKSEHPGDKRGPCIDDGKDNDYAITTKIQCDSNNQDTSQCENNNTYYNYIYNLTFNTMKSNINDYAWVLDYMYRGVNKKGTNMYQVDNQGNWVGRYNYSYLNCQVDPSVITSKTNFNSSLGNKYIPAPSFNDPSPLTNICTNIISNSENTPPVSNQQYSNSSTMPKSCSYDNNEQCNYIKTNLVKWSGPTPPSPLPNKKSSKSNNTLAFISLSMSILVIILLIFSVLLKI